MRYLRLLYRFDGRFRSYPFVCCYFCLTRIVSVKIRKKETYRADRTSGMPILCRVFWPNSLDGLRGPFRLGRFSWGINVASLLFIIVMSVLFVLPTAHPTTSLNMNYAIVAIGGLIVLTTLQYVFWGRKHYNGIVQTYRGQMGFVEAVGNEVDMLSPRKTGDKV